MKRIACLLLVLLLTAGCAKDDPMTGRAGSDLPPGPLQPLPTESATPAIDCRTLAVARGETTSRDDADFLDLVFTNDGSEPCTVHGYPTLTMLDGSGRNMGERATLRTNGAARYIELKSGDSARATVRFPKSADCRGGSSRIEVLIPGAVERNHIAAWHAYCPGWTVTAIHTGSA